MIGSYTFNGVNSESFYLITRSIKRPLLPSRKNSYSEVDGVSGIHDHKTKDYKTRKIIMQSAYIGDDFENLRSRARSIAAWLSTETWAPLIINDEPDKYYLAKVDDELDLKSFLESGTFDVEFNCQPFALSVQESSQTLSNIQTKRTGTINHPGTREINYRSQPGSKFKITTIGVWETISFKINDKILIFNEDGGSPISSSALYIDNIDMTVSKDGVDKFDKLDGDIDTFLELTPGNNTIEIDGTGLLCSVIIEFIPLWI